VSIISILRTLSFSFRVPVCPIDFVRCFLLQYHSYLSWSFLYVSGSSMPSGVGFFSGQRLDVCHDTGFLFSRLASISEVWILCRVNSVVNTSTRRQPPIQDADIGRFGVCWP
jgi:hypothetical protein